MKRMVDILDCLNDRALLGQFIKDPGTWGAWFCFLRAFFALEPLGREDKKLFKQCTGRAKWPEKPSREAWLIIGTRGGKSFVTALLACYLAVFKKYSLSPGEKGYIIIVAPTKKQSGIIKGYLSSFFNENRYLKPFLVRETVEDVVLRNSIVISVLSSDYRSLRGYTAIAGIIDEVAYLTLEGSKPDMEVVRALRSRLLTTKGPLICISSPYAKRGTLYETHKRHWGKSGSAYLVWQAGSRVMNPTLSKESIEQAYSEDPEGAKADYGAEFRSDIETFIAREVVERLVVPGRYELPPVAHVAYSAFVDPSGGARDSMTLAISHQEEGGKRVLDCVRERKAPFSPDDVVGEFAETLRRYGLSTCTGDRYGGVWPESRFRAVGVKYLAAQKPKGDIYRELLPMLNSGEVELLDNETLLHQLVNLERRTARGGKDSIDHAPNAHDDVANAVAGSLVSGTFRKQARIRIIDSEARRMEPVPADEARREGLIPVYRSGRLSGWSQRYEDGGEAAAGLLGVYEGSELVRYEGARRRARVFGSFATPSAEEEKEGRSC